MKVSELIEALQKLDGELEVWTSSDEEGNSFNRVYYDPEVLKISKDDTDRTDQAYTDEDIEYELEEGILEPEDRDNFKSVVII